MATQMISSKKEQELSDAFRENRDFMIKVVLDKDILCRSCSRSEMDGTTIKCNTKKTDQHDAELAKEYGIEIGKKYTQKELQNIFKSSAIEIG